MDRNTVKLKTAPRRRVETVIDQRSQFQAAGSIYGVGATDPGTDVAPLRPDGTLYGEGQGVLMGKGGEAANGPGRASAR